LRRSNVPLCQTCGVELDGTATVCPLCLSRVQAAADDRPSRLAEGPGARAATAGGSASTESGAAVAEARGGSAGPRGRALAVEALSVVFGIAALLCAGIDLYAEGRLGWSPVVLVGLAMGWLLACMPMVLRGKPWLVFAVLCPGELALLLLLDLADGGGAWFLRYGLPIYLASVGALTAVVVLAAASRRKGLNLLALAAAGAAALCLAVEAVLSLAAGGPFVLRWSLFVAAAALPASGLLFYAHYRLFRRPLRRKLRI